jgi:hypothetical protein
MSAGVKFFKNCVNNVSNLVLDEGGCPNTLYINAGAGAFAVNAD